MLTEAEAKTKWCPFARTIERSPDGVTRSRNRVATIVNDAEGTITDVYSAGLLGCACIASACMAWRWEMERYTPEGSDPLATRKPKRPTQRGFCGLAGVPEDDRSHGWDL